MLVSKNQLLKTDHNTLPLKSLQGLPALPLKLRIKSKLLTISPRPSMICPTFLSDLISQHSFHHMFHSGHRDPLMFSHTWPCSDLRAFALTSPLPSMLFLQMSLGCLSFHSGLQSNVTSSEKCVTSLSNGVSPNPLYFYFHQNTFQYLTCCILGYCVFHVWKIAPDKDFVLFTLVTPASRIVSGLE